MSTKFITKISTTIVSIATVVSLSGAGALLPVAYGATIEELQAQISALLAQIQALQAQLTTTPATSSAVPSSLLTSGNLTVGSRGAAVKDLQKFLNGAGYQIAASGSGSLGNETEYFGSLTKAALAKWQAANNVSPALGFFGSITRAKLSSLGAAPTTPITPTTPTTPAPAGSGLTVALAADQPAASLAPGDASRIPFTKLLLTASSDGDVTITAVEVERTGLAADAALDSVILLDENNNQIGLKKTLNSLHRASVGESFVVKAGQSKIVTIGATRAAVGGSYGGQTLALAVTKVSTSANVNAAFPITGTTHTVNETLTIGSVTMARASLDPGASQTKEIGTASYTFSSVKVTAGSAEKIYLKSIRWNQTGSAGSGDLTNVKTYIDSTAYDTTVSSDGKYYTSNFPSGGILIDKGFSKEISIKGDVAGGSSRTVDFDIAKRTDVYVVGETYGYGVIPPQTGSTDPTDDSAAFSNTEDPWYDAAQVLVSSGTMTVSAWTAVAAQNIAINLADQPLGGWTADVKGEPISVANIRMVVTITDSDVGGENSLADLDNLKLVDETGKVLSGPIDASGTGRNGNITFTDTITFPVGVTKMKLVGKLSTNFENNDTFTASTTPSTQFVTVTGQTTGTTIVPSPTSAVSGQSMTVKAAAMTISVATVPISQTVIAGITQFEFARYILDTAASGEDVRLTSIGLEYSVGTGGSATDLTNCKIYDYTTSTVLTTGNNVVNPSAAASSTSFTFDGTGLTLPKGTSKQLSLKCDLKSAASGRYNWGYDSSASPSPTGLTSGQSVTPTENDSAGQTMVAATSGTLAVTLDSGSPSYVIASPGQTAVLAKLRLSATNEDINLKQIALQLTGTASNTSQDLVGQEVEIWDETASPAAKIGTAVFSSTDFATSSAITGFSIPKDGAKVLTIKGKIANITVSGPLVRSGDLLIVDYDGDNEGLNGNYGTGVSSGSTITPTANDTASNGVRILRAYPSFEQIALSTSEKTLSTDGTYTTYKFKVTANSGDVALAKFTFAVASSSRVATTSAWSLYAYTDSAMSAPDSNFNDSDNPGGLINAGNCIMEWVAVWPTNSGCGLGTTTLVVPSGQSRWFKLTASVSSIPAAGTTESFRVQLEGDAAFPTVHQDGAANPGEMGKAFGVGQQFGGLASGKAGVGSDANNDFIWSPISTTTASTINDFDFSNGYSIPGLPSTNMTAETLSK